MSNSALMARAPKANEEIVVDGTKKFAVVVEMLTSTSKGWIVRLKRHGHNLIWHGEVQRQPRTGRLYLDHRIRVPGETDDRRVEQPAAEPARDRAHQPAGRREKRPGRHAALDGLALAHRGKNAVKALRPPAPVVRRPVVVETLPLPVALPPELTEPIIDPAAVVSSIETKKLPGRRWTVTFDGEVYHALYPNRRPHPEDEYAVTHCALVKTGYGLARQASNRCTNCTDCVRHVKEEERRQYRRPPVVRVA